MGTTMDVKMMILDKLEGVGSGEPIAPRWEVFDWGRARGLAGKAKIWKSIGEGMGLYRIDRGDHEDGSWLMDDMVRVMNNGNGATTLSYGGWKSVDHNALQRVKVLWRMMGLDSRIQLCEREEYFPETHSRNEIYNIDTSLEDSILR